MPLIYAPLPKGNHIRLLEGRQGFLSHELVCKFNFVCLDDCKDEYIAISYASLESREKTVMNINSCVH
jgi:hypothetical protein